MIAGLLPALAHDLDVGLPAARSERAKSEGRAVYFLLPYKAEFGAPWASE
jgi:hypothetical protein